MQSMVILTEDGFGHYPIFVSGRLSVMVTAAVVVGDYVTSV